MGLVAPKNLGSNSGGTSCHCSTLVPARVISEQAGEIPRAVRRCSPEDDRIDVARPEHAGPIEWDNFVLYGSRGGAGSSRPGPGWWRPSRRAECRSGARGSSPPPFPARQADGINTRRR